jgi:hypothetical protein
MIIQACLLDGCCTHEHRRVVGKSMQAAKHGVEVKPEIKF